MATQVQVQEQAQQTWSIALQPWPFWGQLTDWTADQEPDENRVNNCGPESIAMCLKYLTGIEMPADFIKDKILGQNATGYTTVDQLTQYLFPYCETHTTVRTFDNMNDYLWYEWYYLHQGAPLIGLYYFSAPGANDGHWRPVVGMTPTTVITADPWTGQARTEDYTTHWQWSKGLLIGIDRTRDDRLDMTHSL